MLTPDQIDEMTTQQTELSRQVTKLERHLGELEKPSTPKAIYDRQLVDAQLNVMRDLSAVLGERLTRARS